MCAYRFIFSCITNKQFNLNDTFYGPACRQDNLRVGVTSEDYNDLFHVSFLLKVLNKEEEEENKEGRFPLQ